MPLFMALSLIFAISCDDNEFPSSENFITKFVINGLDSEINETNNTITITVPYGTDVTKLKPSVQLSDKASITPSPDKETDFSSPVKYIITAEDGSAREYTVSVKVGESDEKKITSFTINEIAGTIDDTNKKVSIVLPHGTDVTKLSPVITTSSNSTVSPESGKELDFTNPVEYTVTAQDGTTQKYTVEITFGQSSAKAITAFSINDIKGSIDEENKKVTISIPFGYDLTKLTPTVEVSENASLSPTSGTQVDLSNPVEYTVTAEDGTTTKYTVNVILGKNTQKEIVAFSINNVKGAIDEENKKVTLTLPAGTDVTKLSPQMTLSASATVSPAADTQADFTNPVEYTVTAEDGTTAKYTVTVTVEKYTGKAITKFVVSGVEATIDEANKTISFTLPVDTDVTKLKPSVTISEGAAVSPATDTQVDFTNPVEYTVTAEDGSTAKYTATANVNKRSDKAITLFTVNGVEATIDEANKTISFTLPAGTDLTKLVTIFLVSEGASANPASGQTDFTNPVEYTVTAEDGSTAKYTATANVTKRSGKAITKFTANNVNGIIDETAKTIKLSLPAGTNVTTLSPVITISDGAQVSPVSGVAQNFTNPVVYTVTAEDGSTQKYTVTIEVAKSSAKAITKFVVNGVDATINETAKTVSYTLPAGVSNTALTPIVYVSEGASLSPGTGMQVDFTNPVIYTVTAEDGSTQKYTVTINVTPATTALKITGVNGTTFSPGMKIIIDGVFEDPAGFNSVYLGSYWLTKDFNCTPTQLIAYVPDNMALGEYDLSVEGDAGNGNETVTYGTKIKIVAAPKPTISSITPTVLEYPGGTMTITGTNFSTLDNTQIIPYYLDEDSGNYVEDFTLTPTSVTSTSITFEHTLYWGYHAKWKYKVKANGVISDSFSAIVTINRN